MVHRRTANIVLFCGKPGAGKGTRTEKLKERTFLLDDFTILSTGQMLRKAVQDGTPIGKEAEMYMQKGELVPDFLVNTVVLDTVKDAIQGKKNLILDGYPRNLSQAQSLVQAFPKQRFYVVYFLISDEMVVQRTIHRRVCPACGSVSDDTHTVCDKCNTALVQRNDDKEEIVRERLASFARDTAPAIDYLTDLPNVRYYLLPPIPSLEEDPGLESFFKNLP